MYFHVLKIAELKKKLRDHSRITHSYRLSTLIVRLFLCDLRKDTSLPVAICKTFTRRTSESAGMTSPSIPNGGVGINQKSSTGLSAGVCDHPVATPAVGKAPVCIAPCGLKFASLMMTRGQVQNTQELPHAGNGRFQIPRRSAFRSRGAGAWPHAAVFSAPVRLAHQSCFHAICCATARGHMALKRLRCFKSLTGPAI